MCLIVPGNTDKGLGRKLCPGMWLVSKSHRSLSLSLTLSLGFFLLHILSNPPHPSLSVLVQVGIPQPGEQSNSFTKFFHQSSKLLSNIKHFPERTTLFLWRISTEQSVPLSYHCQPFTLTDNHPICTTFHMVTDLTPRSTFFSTTYT